MVDAVHFSSKDMTWETPQAFFDMVNAEFSFTLDVCAQPDTAKCARYFTPEIDGLAQDWTGEVCWCNPPYGGEIGKWMRKALAASAQGATVVCLVPARTDTRWFHDYIYGEAEIRFIKGRLKFGGAEHNAPFPSMLVVYRPPNTEITYLPS